MLNLTGLRQESLVEHDAQYEVEVVIEGHEPKCSCAFPSLVLNGAKANNVLRYSDAWEAGRDLGPEAAVSLQDLQQDPLPAGAAHACPSRHDQAPS